MSALNDFAFSDEAFEGFLYSSKWTAQYSFDFEAGATVFITPTWIASIPGGTFARLYFGQSVDDYKEVSIGEKSYILFENDISGTTTLYVKIELDSTIYGTSPTITELVFLIEQTTTLYTITKQILVDGLTGTNTAYYVDPELQLYPIQYAWLPNMSHRKALSNCAEAAGGVSYQDRNGTIRLESGTWLDRKANRAPSFIIGQDRILEMSSPVNDVRNSVQITTKPYLKQAEQTVWELNGNKTLLAGEQKTYVASFDFDAVSECHSVLTGSGASIINEVYYFNRAIITISTTHNVTIGLSILGKPLIISGSRVITETDGESIRKYGSKQLVISDNNLIQTPEIAELIAESAVSILSKQLRDIDITWRGDPSIELGDVGTIDGIKTAIVSQTIEFSGALNETAKLRRL